MKKAIVLSMSLGLVLAATASATSITFGYTSGNLGQGTTGNSIVETISGETLTATAWGLTGNSDTTLQDAALGQYSGFGLGVCNQQEVTARGGCTSPQHEVDDSNQLDFVLFSFSQPVSSVSIVIDPVCNCNTNASYYAGNGISPNGKTLAALGTSTQSIETASDVTRTVTISGLGNVNSILFGADIFQSNNFFKVESISVTPSSAVPEPGTLVLAGFALVVLGSIRFRSNRKSRNETR